MIFQTQVLNPMKEDFPWAKDGQRTKILAGLPSHGELDIPVDSDSPFYAFYLKKNPKMGLKKGQYVIVINSKKSWHIYWLAEKTFSILGMVDTYLKGEVWASKSDE